MSTSYRPIFVAFATTVILLLALSTAAFAATGILGDIFAAVTRGQPGIGSTQAIVDNDYFAEVVSNESNGMSLRAYYVDSKEIGFDFTLSGADVPDGFDMLYIGAFTLVITESNGTVNTWDWLIDRENDVESRTFPGGHFFQDWKNNLYEYEPSEGMDFQVGAHAAKISDDIYNVSVIVTFYGVNVPIGDKAHIAVGDLTFIYFDNEKDDIPNDEYISLSGSWSFDIDIDEKFGEAAALSYAPVESYEAQGIRVTSATVLPTVFRIEAIIDFEKSGLGNPANAERAREMGTNPVKLDMLELYVYVVVDGNNPYSLWSSGYTEAVDGVAACWFEIESSMYFDAPENLTLRLESLGGTTIDIALTRS